MKAEDHGRVYWCTNCGGKYHFETEEKVIQHCKKEGTFHPVKGIDYNYFSDVEEDEGKKGCAKVVNE